MRKISDIAYGDAERQKLDFYLPDSDSFDMIVYFHGGGFKEGSKEKQIWIHGHHQMVNTEIRLIIFFAAKDGEAIYSQQKQDQAHIMNSLLSNSDSN